MGRMFYVELSATTYYSFDEIEADDEAEAEEIARDMVSNCSGNFEEHYDNEVEVTEL